MGRSESTAEIEPPSPGQQMGSYPQSYQTAQSLEKGRPWESTAEIETSNPGQQMGSYPESFQTAQPPQIGRPWESTAGIETPNAGQQMGYYPQSFQTAQPPQIGRPWATELFDCHEDPTNAVMTALFPCVTFGQIAEVMDACPFGTVVYMLTSAVCMEWFIGSTYRTRLRNRYGLVEAPFHDIISHCFCPYCSLCQEFRELKKQGLNPALGFKGILAEQQAKQNGQIYKPPAAQAMSIIEAAEEVETTVKGQPVASYPQNYQTGEPPSVGRPWSTGLFECHLDQTNAVMTAFLPCVTFGQIAEVLDAGEMMDHGSKYRTKLRNRYGLVEAPYQDAVSHIFCSCCSLCQEFRELKNRGLDPALGWRGIIAQQQAVGYGNEQQMNQPPQFQAMSK
ncbi:UNVERIFIED_CONTAM: protein PLANT CADMIUM RESISTANCE 8 [Sesamum angustifolium]|uniref:Protein PLANT CADMIUM RESISTANCE 8 n=1 Tax=Sesamum angustifolium TaxID=2727405 RepID=A0AAW2LKR8_9LAMI